VQSAPTEEMPVVEDVETDETEVNRNEEKEEPENKSKKVTKIESITIADELWDIDKDQVYEIFGEVRPIIRDGDLAILPVLLDSDDDVSVTFNNLFGQSGGTGEGIASRQGYDIRLIDSEEMTVSHPAALILEDQSTKALHTFVGGGVSRDFRETIGASQERAQYYGVFAAPETDNVQVMFRRLGVIENVPVIDRNDLDTLTLEEMDEVMENQGEELDGFVVPTVDEIIESELSSRESELFDGNLERIQARVFPIESYRESLQTSVSRVDEIEHSTLIISSDVLFEFDSSDLTEEAGEELEAAVAELAGVESGALEIVGHTDSEGSEELNQELSEDRAASVERAMGDLSISNRSMLLYGGNLSGNLLQIMRRKKEGLKIVE
jgi:outer membrane protein OmpA-like peptidoglycan-associated protein